jgi:hypothetical protein
VYCETTKPFNNSEIENWHAPCKTLGIGRRMVGWPQIKGVNTMSLRYEFAQRVALSVVASLFFTAVLIGSATSIVPVA